jgi:putative inorganic carbon (hco3(-)) transporter
MTVFDVARIDASARGRTRTVALAAAVAFAALAAGASGRAASGGSKLAIVLPIVIASGIALTVLAVTRFAVFVGVLLVLRASLDIGRVTASAAGNTATNTSASRLADPSTIVAVLLLVAAAVWLAAQMRGSGRLPGSALRRNFLLFAVVALISVSGSERPLSSAVESLRILSVVVMFIVLEQLMRTPDMRRRLLAAAYASLAFPLVFTLVGLVIGHANSESKGGFTRLSGPFTQANTFGRYLMLMIVFGAAIYPHVRRGLRRWMVVAIALSGAFLVLTYTRTALVGAVVGVIAVGIMQNKRVLAALLVGLVAALLFVPQFSGRLSSVATAPTTTQVAAASPSGDSLAWRIRYWTKVLPLADRNPVTGIGLDMTQYQTSAAKQPHSDFIRAYVETGILGLAAYLALLVAMVRAGRRAIRVTAPATFDRGIAVGFLGCAIGYITASLAANIVSNVVTLWYLAAFAAATTSITVSRQVRLDPPQLSNV